MLEKKCCFKPPTLETCSASIQQHELCSASVQQHLIFYRL